MKKQNLRIMTIILCGCMLTACGSLEKEQNTAPMEPDQEIVDIIPDDNEGMATEDHQETAESTPEPSKGAETEGQEGVTPPVEGPDGLDETESTTTEMETPTEEPEPGDEQGDENEYRLPALDD